MSMDFPDIQGKTRSDDRIKKLDESPPIQIKYIREPGYYDPPQAKYETEEAIIAAMATAGINRSMAIDAIKVMRDAGIMLFRMKA